jgi:carboxypeptidase C (cathepsin A)
MLVAGVMLMVGSGHKRSADQITSLPGWNKTLPSRHFSGFLHPTTTTTPSANVHYWLMEAEQVDPSTAPLVMWFNGGPPCSALLGAFTELGPFRTSATGELLQNPGRWNQVANLLFIESPLGVGFSYGSNDGGANAPDHGSGRYAANDTSTAALNLVSLQAFLAAFPEYSTRPLWVAGESYAGIYVPMLALEILRANSAAAKKGRASGASVGGGGGVSINLQGIMVGNGAIATGDWYEGWLTGLRTANAYAHGLYSQQLHEDIEQVRDVEQVFIHL